MTTRSSREDSVHALTVQEAVTETIHRTPGHPPKAIAQDMNVSLGLLYDVADPFRERRLRAEELPALVKATGNYLVLDTIERALDRVAFSLPPMTATSADQVRLAQDAIREFSEALEAWSRAHQDGVVDSREAEEIVRQASEAIAAIARIRAAAEAAQPSRLRAVR